LALALASPTTAWAIAAEEIRAQLRVERGATCLTAHQLALEVEPLLDDVELPTDLVFEVEGSQIDPRRARLRILRDDTVIAERAFEPGPERCGHLHAAVGLAIALAINASQEEERNRVRVWSGTAAALWTYGFLPQLAPGLELLARRDLGEHFRMRAGLLGIAGIDAKVVSPASTFDALWLTARADGCWRTALSSTLRVQACAGLCGGVLHVQGDGAGDAPSESMPWVALSAGADLELAVSEQWALALGISSTYLLHRVQLGVEDTAGRRVETRSLDRVAIALGIGPVYYF
jgi:hypothetical protein